MGEEREKRGKCGGLCGLWRCGALWWDAGELGVVGYPHTIPKKNWQKCLTALLALVLSSPKRSWAGAKRRQWRKTCRSGGTYFSPLITTAWVFRQFKRQRGLCYYTGLQ